ncbi:hypothetical protein [Stenotrophomonas sp. SY1]|uniref:hypothetical protein n=1 Tax=Stenotrophomonas sp. SY1 TaxID=477235 RepID=UPI001E3607D8|nr:hypothetical protein [Stenotrophomonas sp. SY1]MCD9086214.1 hypothetical protein [Stenotrophomonas sp. SY1]
MANEFCPLAADWGNWADWAGVIVALIAAVATICAVRVALRTSREAVNEAKRIRDQDRVHNADAARSRAEARMIVMDHELYVLGGKLKRIKDSLSPAVLSGDPARLGRWIRGQVPSSPLPMLERYAGEVDSIGKEDAAVLLSILAGWYAMQDELRAVHWDSPDTFDIEDVQSATCGAYEMILDIMRDGREVTRKWSQRIRPNLPDTDF